MNMETIKKTARKAFAAIVGIILLGSSVMPFIWAVETIKVDDRAWRARSSNVVMVDTTNVVTVDTTVVEATKVVEDPNPSIAPEQYVCDMPRSLSEEYFYGMRTSNEKYYDNVIPAHKYDTIIMSWQIPVGEQYDIFVAATKYVATVTGKNIVVVQGKYTSGYHSEGEYTDGYYDNLIIPVIVDNETESGILAYIKPNYKERERNARSMMTFGIGREYFAERFVINGFNTVLHEYGHVFGLWHTHREEGLQINSVMSYESSIKMNGYLPGDIAGLQSLLCD